MGKFPFTAELRTRLLDDKKDDYWFLENSKFEKFDTEILGLGPLNQPSEQIEALACNFDLSAFTSFCSQVDPHLAIPEFLSGFLHWLFIEIRNESVQDSYEDGKRLWATLPFLAKFLGDGVLFLWDAQNMELIDMCNVIVTLRHICRNYRDSFYPKIRRRVVDPPQVLRCGIARGRVCSVGNGDDYVGPCINIASRLQKLSDFTFCFSNRGLQTEAMLEEVRRDFVLKTVSLRGIGEAELVWVLEDEFRALPPEKQAQFGEA